VKILIADDDELYRHAIERALTRWDYEVVMASDGNSALQILQGPDPPEMAILDWMMPGLNGTDICSRIRRSENDTYVYIVLISVRNQMDQVLAGLQSEADDYLIKPFNFQELRARLQAGKRVVRLQADLAIKNRELSYRATHDSLTDLWNRPGIMDIAGRELAREEREGRRLCLAIADIDHFKEINDRFGHRVGDAILYEAAQRMKSALRSYDFVGRYGGEEFLVIMPGLDENMSINLAERLRMQIGAIPFYAMGRKISITISLGVTINNELSSLEHLINAADEALYRAKARGRNRVEFAETEAGYTDKRLLLNMCGLALMDKEGEDKRLQREMNLFSH
jgi:two-component system, cell cycle response regulator